MAISRDINRGKVWRVVYSACRAWGLPGLAINVKVRLSDRLMGMVHGKKRTCIGLSITEKQEILINRRYWKKHPRCSCRGKLLVHELAHLALWIKRGNLRDAAHGKHFAKLMKQAGVHDKCWWHV